MSYAKKANGYRGITVEGTRYRWCFRSGAQDSTVTLQGAESGGQQAVAVMRDCPDPWLAFPADNPVRKFSDQENEFLEKWDLLGL